MVRQDLQYILRQQLRVLIVFNLLNLMYRQVQEQHLHVQPPP
jgi:hypothetical protein